MMSYEDEKKGAREVAKMLAAGTLPNCKWCGSPLRPLLGYDVACTGPCSVADPAGVGWVGVVGGGRVGFFADPRPAWSEMRQRAAKVPRGTPLLCRLGLHKRTACYRSVPVSADGKAFVVSGYVDYFFCSRKGCGRRLNDYDWLGRVR